VGPCGLHSLTCLPASPTDSFALGHSCTCCNSNACRWMFRLHALLQRRRSCRTIAALSMTSQLNSSFLLNDVSLHKMFGAHSNVIVKALCYKPEIRGFETRWNEWMFSIYQSFRPHWVPGITQPLTKMITRSRKIMSPGSRVERGRCAGLTTLPPSVSRLSRQFAILNISQPSRPPWRVKGVAFFLLFAQKVLEVWGLNFIITQFRLP
jgi:hypothetical protein